MELLVRLGEELNYFNKFDVLQTGVVLEVAEITGFIKFQNTETKMEEWIDIADIPLREEDEQTDNCS